MIKIVNGSIFDSKCNFITNPVNCIGVMGKGLAKEFKQRYPMYYIYYLDMCNKHTLHMGKPEFYYGTERMIITFPTKYDWRDNSKLEDIDKGLANIAKQTLNMSIAFPALGCGLGKLNFDDVVNLFVFHFKEWEKDIEIYEPR